MKLTLTCPECEGNFEANIDVSEPSKTESLLLKCKLCKKRFILSICAKIVCEILKIKQKGIK